MSSNKPIPEQKIDSIIAKQNSIIQWNKANVDNGLDSMIIDVLYDNSNINASSTGQIYQNHMLSTTTSATILWNVYNNGTTIPVSTYVVADYTLSTGTIVFSISRDGGTTFLNCSLGVLTDISTEPSGSNIILKVVITGSDVTLNAVGYGWK